MKLAGCCCGICRLGTWGLGACGIAYGMGMCGIWGTWAYNGFPIGCSICATGVAFANASGNVTPDRALWAADTNSDFARRSSGFLYGHKSGSMVTSVARIWLLGFFVVGVGI
jgi:hypothetical protein